MSWTDERISTLKKMWGAGKSASEIAEKLGGVTRNAVIGKAHRLGLSGRPSPIKKVAPKKAASAAPVKKPAAPKAVPAPKAVTPVAKPKVAPSVAPAKVAPVVRTPANTPSKPVEIVQLAALANASSRPDGSTISILELSERTCRWPVGDPKDTVFGYCGSSVYAPHPYCAEHVAIAFQAPNRKDKKPVRNLKEADAPELEELEDLEIEVEGDDDDIADDTLEDDLDDDTPVTV